MKPRWWWAMIGALALAGCGPKGYDESKPPEESAEALAAKAAADRAAARLKAGLGDDLHSLSDPIAPLAQTPATGVADYTWNATPDLANVPQTMVTGRLRNRDFIARYAAVSFGEEAKQPVFRLRFSSLPKGDIAGFSLDDDAVELNWSNPIEPGTLFKKLDEPRPPTVDAWFVIEQADGVPLTQSAPFGCALQIDEVRGPTEPGGAPSLLGRVAICFGDDAKSWIAGTFSADGVR